MRGKRAKILRKLALISYREQELHKVGLPFKKFYRLWKKEWKRRNST